MSAGMRSSTTKKTFALKNKENQEKFFSENIRFDPIDGSTVELVG